MELVIIWVVEKKKRKLRQILMNGLGDTMNGRNEMKWNKLKARLDVWSLYYRAEIVWFTIGFIIGALVL